MSKGFDDALARVLKTTKHILFSDYVNVSPEAATVKWALNQDEDLPWFQPEWLAMTDRDRLQYLMMSIKPAELAMLVQIAVAMKQAHINEDRREFIEQAKKFPIPDSPHFPPLPANIAAQIKPPLAKSRSDKRKK